MRMFNRLRRSRKSLATFICTCCVLVGPLLIVTTWGDQGLAKQLDLRFVQLDGVSGTGNDGVRIRRLIQHPVAPFYNISAEDLITASRELPQGIMKLFDDQVTGFFVNIGSDGKLDGTLWLEQTRAWDGLIIEPDLDKYTSLVHMRRKVQLLNACLKIGTEPWCRSSPAVPGRPTVSLEAVIQAVNNDVIDLLVVDIPGRQEEFLQTFPFEAERVTMVSVTFPGTQVDTSRVYATMKRRGYIMRNIMVSHVVKTTRIFFTQKYNLSTTPGV